MPRCPSGEAIDRSRAQWRAKAAEGDVLAFVDADSQIHPETFNAIERTLASGGVIIGATGFRYDRMSLAMWIQFRPGMGGRGFQEDRLVAVLTGRGSFSEFIQRYWYEERK